MYLFKGIEKLSTAAFLGSACVLELRSCEIAA